MYLSNRRRLVKTISFKSTVQQIQKRSSEVFFLVAVTAENDMSPLILGWFSEENPKDRELCASLGQVPGVELYKRADFNTCAKVSAATS